MDGKRIQEYWSNEMSALLNTYRQFQVLLPSEKNNASVHNGEDGRYVETLLKEYLKKYLPNDLEVLTGFILRPAVKTGVNGRRRKNDEDCNSTQLDIIIYNSSQFPIFQRFGDSVIVPPEGVIGILSVKKTLNDNDIIKELTALRDASKLCRCIDQNGAMQRGPFLALVSMESNINKKQQTKENWIFDKIKKAYTLENIFFDDLVGFIGALNEWSIFKKRPKGSGNEGEYIYFEHTKDEFHLGFQFILTGLLSVFYDTSRSTFRRPGFTAFPSNRNHNKVLGRITTEKLR